MAEIQTYYRDGRKGRVVLGTIESRRLGTRDLQGLECADVRPDDGTPTITVLVRAED